MAHGMTTMIVPLLPKCMMPIGIGLTLQSQAMTLAWGTSMPPKYVWRNSVQEVLAMAPDRFSRGRVTPAFSNFLRSSAVKVSR